MSGLLVPVFKFLVVNYDVLYIVHCAKRKRYGAVLGIALIVLLICVGTVLVELPYIR